MAVINVAIGYIWGMADNGEFYLWPTFRYDLWHDVGTVQKYQFVMSNTNRLSSLLSPITIHNYTVAGTKDSPK